MYKRYFKGASSHFFPPFFFSKSLRFWYHKNCHIFLIIILKFHALIPLRLEENCKNSPILLTWWLPPVNNHVLASFAVYSLKTAPHFTKETGILYGTIAQ